MNLPLALAPPSSLIGRIFIVVDGISSVTGKPETLAGLRVEVVGAGWMVGDLSVRLVDPIERIARILAERDAWWTEERVEDCYGRSIVEFDRDALRTDSDTVE